MDCVDRMLGVIPVSNRWLATFSVIDQRKPAVLVSGFGRVPTLAIPQADTQVHLLALRALRAKAVDGAPTSARL